MNEYTTMRLEMENTMFAAMRRDFNMHLQQTLITMDKKESNEATITLKLSIALQEAEVSGLCKAIIKPKLSHKITSQMTMKNETIGEISGDYELVWDKTMLSYIMRPIDDGQMTMFEVREQED